MITLYHLGCPFVITNFKRHETVKQEFLELIEHSPGKPITDYTNIISRSDWKIDSSVPRTYIENIIFELNPYMEQIYKELDHNSFEYQNFWYQQYVNGDEHDWHQHRGASWANVYFLELPEDGPKTTFRDSVTKEVIVADVKEGDILTFPGIVWHRSPPNESKERKTIISFNVR